MPRKFLQRRPVFVGWEGESEQSYARLVARLVEQQHKRVHIDPHVLQPGAGDPCAIIEQAAKRVHDIERHRDRYAVKVIILDADTRGQAPERDARGLTMARRMDFRLIWQDPCHEALLLRHLENCQQRRPPRTPIAEQQLKSEWPAYVKPMAASQLAERLDAAALRRATQVEGELRAFLDSIGFC